MELLIKLGLDASQEALICEKASLINNIQELTINDDSKLIEATIRLSKDLRSSFIDL